MGKATEAPNKTDKTIELLMSMMKRNRLELIDVQKAINVIVGRTLRDTILGLRKDGKSIRHIARFVHMDDKKVSAFLKKCAACGKECRPSEPCKSCRRCK